MAKPKKAVMLFLGILLGFFVVRIARTFYGDVDQCSRTTPPPTPSTRFELQVEERDSREKLLFVGVMTAAQYLETRAKAAYETWGSAVPGKIAFFSSEGSRSSSVPLVALSGVDDSYPPQKKSFTMLKYMHDHFIDR